MDRCSHLTNRGLVALAQNCSGLQHFSLSSSSQITDEALIPIAQNCSQLQSLTIRFRFGEQDNGITDQTFIEIAQKCPQLQALTIEMLRNLTDQSLLAIAQNCPLLETLEFPLCKRFSDQLLIGIAQNCRRLKTLISYRSVQATQQAFIALAQNCPNLQTLELESTRESFTDESIIQFVPKFIKSLKFNILLHPGFTYQSLVRLAQDGSNLQTLVIQKSILSDDLDDRFDHIEIKRDGPQLNLLFPQLSSITDQTLVAITQNCPDLQNLVLLDCSNLTDESLIQIGANCTKLKKLVVQACPGMTDEGVATFVQNCRYLKHLQVDRCLRLTEESFIHIARTCTELLELTICLHPELTDQSLVRFAQNCSNVPILMLEQSEERVTGLNHIQIDRDSSKLSIFISEYSSIVQTLPAFAQNVPNLTFIGFKTCLSLTDEDLIQIAASNPKLESLLVSACPGVTDQGPAAFIQNCPKLKTPLVDSFSSSTEERLIQLTSKQIEALALGIHLASEFTDQSLTRIAQNCPGLATLSFLRSDLIPGSSFEEKILISRNKTELMMVISESLDINDSLIGFAQNCRHLRNLGILGYKVTEERLIELSQNCPHLEHFNLINCRDLTDQGLATFIGNASNLKSMQVVMCSGITQNAFIQGSKSCPNLKDLAVEFPDLMTDELLIHLARIYPNLTNLEIGSKKDAVGPGVISHSIDRGLMSLVETCSQLKSVAFHGCPQIESETIQKIREAHTTLQIEFLP